MQTPTWPALEATWAAHNDRDTRLYKHTDLVSLLCDAQRTVHAFGDAHKNLVAEVQAAHPRVMTDLPDASAFRLASRAPSAASVTGESTTAPPCLSVPDSYDVLYRDHLVKIQAPMVRCSRPAFRRLCRLWDTTLSYTHMILADSFTKSPAARHADFALYEGEDRLVVQLAAKSGPSAAAASVLLTPYCDAIDLNCGCPQRWAMREGLGSALLDKPEVVADMVKCIRNAMPDRIDCADPRAYSEDGAHSPYAYRGGSLPCVVKMRVQDDLRRSVDFARQCVAAGAGWLTVHGRTPHCAPSATVRWEAVRLLQEIVTQDSAGAVPVVVNGGVSSPTEALEAALGCGVGSVMVANGLLDNPAMFHLPDAAATTTARRATQTASPQPPLHFVPSGQSATVASLLSQEGKSPQVTAVEVGKMVSGAQVASPVALPGLSMTPLEVISDFVRAAIATDLMFPTTVQQVLRMARVYLSPAERVHVSMLRSNLSVLTTLQQLGIYVEEGRYQLNW